jgi:phosphohistidine phosphatase
VTSDVFLVRHGIAAEPDGLRWPGDRERPLTDEGEKSFRSEARGLAKITEPPEAVFSSPLVRALQTAKILEEDARWPAASLMPELEPDVSALDVIAALSSRPMPASFALVGHEPSLSLLAGALLGDAEIEIKKGGVARLHVDAFKPGGGRLRWLLPPKVLRKL